MYNQENGLLFPPKVIPELLNLRGSEWNDLLEEVLRSEDNRVETLSFVLMMVRINGCLFCDTDSSKALHGCLRCSSQSVRRYQGNDVEVIDLFSEANREISLFLRIDDSIN